MHRRSFRNLLFVILFSCVASLSVKAENEPKFIENKGQLPAHVSHKLRVANSDIYFEKDRLTFNFYAPHLLDQHDHGNEHESDLLGHAYYMRFVGASNQAIIESTGNQYPDYTNYITHEYSASHVRSYDRLRYAGIYPGIDIAYFGKEGNLKYDVIVSAGADANLLKMAYDGADAVYLQNEKLIVVNAFNSVEESIPLAYQTINGVQTKVECRYVLNGTTVSFEFPNGYDESKELVIDPTLVFSSYTGSTSNNFGFTATYDQNGALYGGGIAFGLGYPTVAGSYSVGFNGGTIDIAISKFSANGASLIYSTYLGGNNAEAPHSMIVNSQGQLVILGSTSSTNYPTSVGAYDNTFNGGTPVNYASNGVNFTNGSDIVVSILSADGSTLVGSTFLGGSLNDGVNNNTTLSYNYGDIFRGEVVVDAADNIYITSSTVSANFPTTPGSIDQTLGGGQDAICAKFNSNVSALLWSTYLGGNGADAGYSLKLNSTGDIYFVGGTVGQNFPIVGNTLHTTYQGGTVDGYIAHISNDGSTLLGSSYIGTSSYDQVYFVEVDTDDDVYLYGQSQGSYPVSGGVYSNTNSKQFIQKLSPDLSTSIFSTVFGSGSAGVNISPTAFLVDNCQRIFVSGWGGGTNNSWNNITGNTNGMATTTDGEQLTTDGSDFYFMVLEADAASLLYGSYFGGNGVQEHVDGGTSRFNKDGVIHQAVCAGCGGSNAFPTTPGVVSNINGNSCNLGVIKLDLGVSVVDVEIDGSALPTQCLQVPATISFQANVLIADEFEWFFGDGATSTDPNPSHTYTSPGTYEIMLVGRNPFCDLFDTSLVTLVTILPADTANAGLDVQICLGDSVQLQGTGGDFYTWLPVIGLSDPSIENPMASPVLSTVYVLSVTTLDGCASTDAVTVTVLNTNFQVSSDETICFGDTAQISASGATSYLWSPNVDISNLNIADPLVFPASTQTYYVEMTDANNCVGSDSVLITVQSLPIANAGPDQSICVGEQAQLIATGGLNYSWNPSGSLSNASISNPVASPTSTTDYEVTVSDNLGCSNTDTVTITVNPLPTVNAGADATLCLGQTVQLAASGADTYVWTPTTGLSDPNISNPTAEPLVPTEYVVEGTDINGCINTDTVFVDVFVVNAIGDTIICFGDQVQIGVIGGVSWSWTPTTGLSNPNAQFPNANPTSTTVYTVTADDGTGCLASDTVTVVVSPLPIAFAGFDQGVCGGGSVQLNATGGVIYQWTPTTGLSNPNIPNPVVTFSSDTVTYTVTVTNIIGCQNTDAVTVWQEPLPDAQAGPDTTICAGGTVQLTSSGGQTYTWSPTAGLNNPNTQNPTATPLTTTTYTVTVGQPTGNLVFNGNFSQGNVGFSSDYTYATQLNPAGLYSVVTNANSVHNAFQGTGHTGNAPLDSFMVVNGAGTPNLNVWCQTISVSPNTDYFFGAWVSTVVANNPAILQFSINGQVLGSPFSAPFNINNWVQFFQTWNSGSGTSATICVVNQNTTTGGNDFALDDITFSTFCTNTADVTVTVNPLPTANAGPDQSICIGETTQMAGSGGTSYQWVPPIALADPTNPTTDANPIITRTYTLIVQDNIGCEATDDMTLTVNPLPQASAGPDHEICVGESVVLQGSGGTVYQWSPAIDLDDPNTQLPISTPSNSITYTLTVTDNNQCENTDQTTVTVNPLPIVDAGLDSMICANQTIILQATGADSYLWSPLVGLSDPQSANPSASPLNETIYYVTGTDANGCVNSDSVNITIFGVAANSGDYVICLNDSVQALVIGGATYNWSPTDGVSNPSSATPYLSPETSTNYTISVTSTFGCLAETEVNVQVLTLPIAGFVASFDASCDGIFASFDNFSANAQNYFWSFGDGTTSSDNEPTHTYMVGPGNIITLVAYNNDSLCVDSLTIDYSGQWFGNDSIDIEYPNIFTPNYDGINDCFKPEFDGRFSDCYELKVFNRWGELLFESVAGQNHCWDGRTKGGLLVPEGTYYYISVVRGMDHAGYVTVIY